MKNRVGEYRRKRGLSQPELARRTAISRRMIQIIESGESVPSVEKAARLARVLGVKIETLFPYDEDAA